MTEPLSRTKRKNPLKKTPVPLLPLLLDGRHLKPRMPLPKVGEHDAEV